MDFKEALRREMLEKRAKKVSKDTSVDDLYREMMIQGLHNKIKVNN